MSDPERGCGLIGCALMLASACLVFAIVVSVMGLVL